MAENASSVAVAIAVPPPAEVYELEAIASQAAYDSFVVAARAIEPGEVEECRADIPLAYYNVLRGVENVLGSSAAVVGKLPNVQIEQLTALPRLAQGLAYAALQVQRELRSSSFGTFFERAQALRRKLSKAADALAEANLFPAVDVAEARIHSRIDVVDECEALAALFRKHAAAAEGRSPVTKTDLQEVDHVTRKLRAALGEPPAGAEPGEQPPLAKATDMRDRLWTLLSQRHDVLWRCGAWLYGRTVDERVPPLPSRKMALRQQQLAQQAQLAAQLAAERERLAPAPVQRGAPIQVHTPSYVPSSGRESRYLNDLERKTRFLVRFGVIPPQR